MGSARSPHMGVRDSGLTGNGDISRGLNRRSGSQVGRDTDRLEDRGDGDERLGVSDGELVTAAPDVHDQQRVFSASVQSVVV